jgi:hypothetical protein
LPPAEYAEQRAACDHKDPERYTPQLCVKVMGGHWLIGRNSRYVHSKDNQREAH